jgi:pimeloyl-ACP methyl ester carboxylesterase
MHEVPETEVSRSPKPRRWRRVLLTLLAGFLIAVIALAVMGGIYQRTATESERQTQPPVGELINVGDYALHLHCTGEGSPTVVLIAGAGNMYAHWDTVQTGLSAHTRVCSYDRAGTGWSDLPATRPDLAQHVEDLHTLLKQSGEPGPYILVGHSMGGIQARQYYARYPDEVRGIVLVDSSVEGMYQRLPSIIAESNRAGESIWHVCRVLAPFGVMRLLGLGNSYANAFPDYSDAAKGAIAATFYRNETCTGQLWETALTSVLESGNPLSLGEVPLVVITRGMDEMQANPNARFSEAQIAQFRQVQADWLVLQKELAGLSSNSRQVIADQSGHFIQASQPELVVNAVRDLMSETQPQ